MKIQARQLVLAPGNVHEGNKNTGRKIKEIDLVSNANIKSVARQVFDFNKMRVAVIGDIKKKKKLNFKNMKYIFGNWKMYLDYQESDILSSALATEGFDASKVSLAVFRQL